jgi:ribosomal protein S18 acetylase RimI-like enzyme
MDIEIREYRPEDEAEWMRVHAVILSTSHSWNYTIQERPAYEGHQSTRLVAMYDGKIVGLTDTQYENTIGELCFLKDSPGGYVLEFGRLPEYAGRQIGKLLIDATVTDAAAKGFRRLEFWSQDRRAQRYYARLGRDFRLAHPGPRWNRVPLRRVPSGGMAAGQEEVRDHREAPARTPLVRRL